MDAQALLDWQLVREWAKKQSPDTIVGTSCTNTDCPVARYLNEKTGHNWSVGPSIKRMGSTQRLTKPEWIDDLIAKVDELTDNTSASVNCLQFLEIMEQAEGK